MVAAFPVSSTLCASLAAELKYREALPVAGVAGVPPACPVITKVPVSLVVSAFCHPELSHNHVFPLAVSLYTDPAVHWPDGTPVPLEAAPPVSKVQVLVVTQAYRLAPGGAAVIKYNAPIIQVEGSDVPVCTGSVYAARLKSTDLLCVLRSTCVWLLASMAAKTDGSTAISRAILKNFVFFINYLLRAGLKQRAISPARVQEFRKRVVTIERGEVKTESWTLSCITLSKEGTEARFSGHPVSLYSLVCKRFKAFIVDPSTLVECAISKR
jgi:hypothetical protein